MRLSTISAIVAFASLGACASHPSNEQMARMSGMDIYRQLCTSCHGVGGEGNGPMAPLLKIDVPDLTLISARHGGQFPVDYVRRTIDGRFERPAHGLPYMPVWGLRFSDPESPRDSLAHAQSDSIIDRLVEYLRSLQRATP